MLFVGISTEILSFFNLITRTGIFLSWLALILAMVGWAWKISRTQKNNIRDFLSDLTTAIRSFLGKLGLISSIIVFSILTISLIVAIGATPNNLDSLCYHLSRLGYWIQNQNVGHYASHIERSISFSPLSEYVHLHTFLLNGNERFVQSLQWSSMLGILMLVSLITEHFSTHVKALRLAVISAACLPIAILESMTTQNDLVVSFFIIASVWYIYQYISTGLVVSLLLLVLTVALGIMTKAVYVFYTLPFAILLIVHLVKVARWKTLISLGFAVFILTLALNSPFWYRTYRVFDTPLGNMSKGNQNKIDSPQAFLSSTSKHLFLHLGFVSPQNRYNEWLENHLEDFHKSIGQPLHSQHFEQDFKMNRLNFNEDFAHNFVAMWLILIALILLPYFNPDKRTIQYFLLVIAGFLVFCFFIGYQHYGSRLHLPFFLLATPALGILYGKLSSWIVRFLSVILWLQALPFALLSTTHPLISTQWFLEKVFPTLNQSLHLGINVDNIPNLKQPSFLTVSPEKVIWRDDAAAIDSMKRYINSFPSNNIGFDFNEASLDYAYQFSLRRPERHFEHIMVKNQSRILENNTYLPDCIISENTQPDVISYHGHPYRKEWESGFRRVYRRE